MIKPFAPNLLENENVDSQGIVRKNFSSDDFLRKVQSGSSVIRRIFESLDVRFDSSGALVDTLPFSPADSMFGTETELNAHVKGKAKDVELARRIFESTFYRQAIYDSRSSENPTRSLRGLEDYLLSKDGIWDYSWVRFSESGLSDLAKEVLEHDLLFDRTSPEAGVRSDIGSFCRENKGDIEVRTPVSYLLKIALADYLGCHGQANLSSLSYSLRFLSCFTNDNTAPETISFYLTPMTQSYASLGKEISLRFFLSHLLCSYANERFGLTASGQTAAVCLSPLPPEPLRKLNEATSDNFFRCLFMNPCLSGWNRGEDKLRYMERCHDVLSKSRYQSIRRLYDLDILESGDCEIRALSTTSLMNNGIHASMSSHILGSALAEKRTLFNAFHEKHFGDLAARCFEHFIPLFVGHFSAAPYKFEAEEFRAERVLGFLPHQLHPMHLKIIWSEWQRKLARSPENGVYVPDLRLLDYLVSPLSTESVSAVNGISGNQAEHKHQLKELGSFDPELATYLMFRQREHATSGYSGFEGRFYSAFPSIEHDFSRAMKLQGFITAFAFKLIAEEKLLDEMLPNDPVSESERRHLSFSAAIGLGHVFIRKRTPSVFFERILSYAPDIKVSRMHAGFWCLSLESYGLALLAFLRAEGSTLIELYEAEELLLDLESRIAQPATYSAHSKMSAGILEKMGSPGVEFANAREFNLAAEEYYRDELKQKLLAEGLSYIAAANPHSLELQNSVVNSVGSDGFLATEKLIQIVLNTLSIEKEKSAHRSYKHNLFKPEWEDAA